MKTHSVSIKWLTRVKYPLVRYTNDLSYFPVIKMFSKQPPDYLKTVINKLIIQSDFLSNNTNFIFFILTLV